jgi:hypothetical protein
MFVTDGLMVGSGDMGLGTDGLMVGLGDGGMGRWGVNRSAKCGAG